VFVALLVILALAGCSSTGTKGEGTTGAGGDASAPGEPVEFSCTIPSFGLCSVYTELPPGAAADAAKDECGTQNGTLGTTCSTVDLIGCCALTQSGGGVSICYYGGGILTREQATNQCSQTPGGAWSEPA
jgi:hypothetical protein